MKSSRRRSAAFTLIELMITIAILAVTLMVAAASFMEYRRNSELSDAVGNMILAANAAKSAALETGRNVIVRPNDTGAGWTSSWFVFIGSDWDDTYEGTDEVVMRQEAVSNIVSATPAAGTTLAANYLMFNGQGFPRTTAGAVASGSVTFATTSRSTAVIIDSTGRARSCKTGTTGCTAT